MPFGLFGPIHLRTKRGTRVTFFAGFITLPLTAWSLWQIFGSSIPQHYPDQGQKELPHQPTDGADLSR